MDRFCFTIFTPTLNSSRTLPRVFESLRVQTFMDFEWLIVDDGSTDDTELLVDKWKRQPAFPIRCLHQQSRGKHRAFNRAVIEARGDHFIRLDADDACVPETLEKFYAFWEAIPQQDRESFSGVTVHCTDADGKIIGNRFPENCMDLLPVEFNARHQIRGEKWVLYRTDILRRFPYPEIEGENFIPEAIVRNRIGTLYKMRYVNEAFRIYHNSPRGLTTQRRGLQVGNPIGARLFAKETLSLPYPYQVWSGNMKDYIAFSLHADIAFRRIVKESGFHLASVFLFPLGYARYLLDRMLYPTSISKS